MLRPVTILTGGGGMRFGGTSREVRALFGGMALRIAVWSVSRDYEKLLLAVAAAAAGPSARILTALVVSSMK